MPTMTGRPARRGFAMTTRNQDEPSPLANPVLPPIAGAGTDKQKAAKLEYAKSLIKKIYEVEKAKADKTAAFNKEIKRLQAELFDLAIKDDSQFQFDFEG